MKRKIIAFATAAFFGTTVFIACKKDEAASTAATESKGGAYVKRQGAGDTPEGPMRRFLMNEPECDAIRENCAPNNIEISGDYFQWDDYGDGHGWVKIGDWVWEYLGTPEAPRPFRTSPYSGVFLSNFNYLGIETQAQLDRLDDATFYKTLFKGLGDEHVRMLYSNEYRIALAHNEKMDRYCVFVVRKDVKSPEEGFYNPVLVIPIIPVSTK